MGREVDMAHASAQVRFGALDEAMLQSARNALSSLAGPSGQGGRLALEPGLADLVTDMLKVLVDAGGIAYGPVGAELSPERAGRILGVSRPLVVLRMEDGRLPFHYVGAHRRCRLTDVLALKASEARQNEALAAIYDDLMDVDDVPAP